MTVKRRAVYRRDESVDNESRIPAAVGESTPSKRTAPGRFADQARSLTPPSATTRRAVDSLPTRTVTRGESHAAPALLDVRVAVPVHAEDQPGPLRHVGASALPEAVT